MKTWLYSNVQILVYQPFNKGRKLSHTGTVRPNTQTPNNANSKHANSKQHKLRTRKLRTTQNSNNTNSEHANSEQHKLRTTQTPNTQTPNNANSEQAANSEHANSEQRKLRTTQNSNNTNSEHANSEQRKLRTPKLWTTQTLNTQTPNTQTPNTRTPNTRTPNKRTPNNANSEHSPKIVHNGQFKMLLIQIFSHCPQSDKRHEAILTVCILTHDIATQPSNSVKMNPATQLKWPNTKLPSLFFSQGLFMRNKQHLQHQLGEFSMLDTQSRTLHHKLKLEHFPNIYPRWTKLANRMCSWRHENEGQAHVRKHLSHWRILTRNPHRNVQLHNFTFTEFATVPSHSTHSCLFYFNAGGSQLNTPYPNPVRTSPHQNFQDLNGEGNAALF